MDKKELLRRVNEASATLDLMNEIDGEQGRDGSMSMALSILTGQIGPVLEHLKGSDPGEG